MTTILSYPHPTTTKIDGKPTFATITVLKRETYANTRAIASHNGGAENGHLGLLMEAAAYTAINNGVAWVEPLHPGPQPPHGPAATQFVIIENNRTYDVNCRVAEACSTVKSDLRRMILSSVDNVYLSVLEDPIFGFANVGPGEMLRHLETTYGQMSQSDLEKNRDQLKEEIDLDSPIELLWTKVRQIRLVATNGGEPITEDATIRLLIPAFEASGVFENALDVWRRKDAADKTLANFILHFTAENKERLRKLTAKQAGYQGANRATQAPAPAPTPAPAPATDTNRNAGTSTVTTNNGIKMYYCWTHGLGTNRAHTSATCQNKGEGHKDDATADNLMGGCDRIMAPRRRQGNRNQTNNSS